MSRMVYLENNSGLELVFFSVPSQNKEVDY